MNKLLVIWFINIFLVFLAPYLSLDFLADSPFGPVNPNFQFGIIVNILYLFILIYLEIKYKIKNIIINKNTVLTIWILFLGALPVSVKVIEESAKFFGLNRNYFELILFLAIFASFVDYIIWERQYSELKKSGR